MKFVAMRSLLFHIFVNPSRGLEAVAAVSVYPFNTLYLVISPVFPISIVIQVATV